MGVLWNIKYRAMKSIFGFSLIEMLVIVVFIGVLSAIAIPSFLNQANKSRESEPRQHLTLFLLRQRIFYHENNYFAETWEELDTKAFQPTENYSYELFSTANDGVGLLVNKQKVGLNSFVGGIKAINNKQGNIFVSAQCKSIKPHFVLTKESLLVAKNQILCGRHADQIK